MRTLSFTKHEMEIRYILECFLFANKRIPITPKHTDSHPPLHHVRCAPEGAWDSDQGGYSIHSHVRQASSGVVPTTIRNRRQKLPAQPIPTAAEEKILFWQVPQQQHRNTQVLYDFQGSSHLGIQRHITFFKRNSHQTFVQHKALR